MFSFGFAGQLKYFKSLAIVELASVYQYKQQLVLFKLIMTFSMWLRVVYKLSTLFRWSTLKVAKYFVLPRL